MGGFSTADTGDSCSIYASSERSGSSKNKLCSIEFGCPLWNVVQLPCDNSLNYARKRAVDVNCGGLSSPSRLD